MRESVLFSILQDIGFCILFVGIAVLFGRAFYKIYKGKPIWGKKPTGAVEGVLYKAFGVDPQEEMTPKKYAVSVLLFSGIGLALGFIILMAQQLLWLNPEGVEGMSWHLAFNTVSSFVTNTNWQAYSGETQASYLSQMLVMNVQNFVSGSTGIAVLFALIRGFTRKEKKTIGNFWVDLTRITLFVLPVCLGGTILLVSQGVPQTINGAVSFLSLEGAASKLYLGPAASQIIIKQLFTNGGGFYGCNSAVPFENPTAFSNLMETLSLLVIPGGLCFTFGKAIIDNHKAKKLTGEMSRVNIRGIAKEKNQGLVLFIAVSIIFIICLTVCTAFEFAFNEVPAGVCAAGNMEGKEVRFGIGGSSLWAVATTSVSNGSVNAMHDSFTSIGGMIPMFLMMLGEIVYGGVGCGLYGLIAFALLTVFIAGLMVGRTPEYIGKKIGSYDMKMVCLIILTPVLCCLIGTAATVMMPDAANWINNGGAHGFSEILYGFASMANNNGSAFAGFAANTPWTNVSGGIVMLLVRFVPMIATVFLAGSLASKKHTPQSDGTLHTANALFIGLLIAVIIIVGALSFFPALSLGPIAEYVA
ncbi:MAG: potassium-transporting ATPase subunit KdpA [Christensenellaceae bacterium]|nr:potassium-transporting ATPase subunit KdpA [Christensenellaceae bacterium]